MNPRSALLQAVRSGEYEQVAALLRDGADAGEPDRYGMTPLMEASSSGQVDIMRLLLDNKADLHAVDRQGYEAIHYAAMRGGAEAVRLLVRFEANVNASNLPGGTTPLREAAAHCNRALVEEGCAVLLAAGADVNARSAHGTTALWSAAVAGRERLVDFLLRHGADLDIRDREGRTVLMFVVKMGFFDGMARHLLGHGADADARDAEGRTALMYAALRARRSFADILLEAGANIGLQDLRGWTALMHAAGEAPQDSVIGILGREASTTPEDDNAPPENVGTARGRRASRRTKGSGEDTTHTSAEKQAARLAEATQERARFVRYLLERGADPEQRDAQGRTALDIARENGRMVQADNADIVAALSSATP